MQLLYVDESGSTADPRQSFFVLAGFSIGERRGYWIGRRLDAIAARFDPADPRSIELHGSPMLQGRGSVWATVPSEARIRALCDALDVLKASGPRTRVFAIAVRKAATPQGDPVAFAFEQLLNRFDRYLLRLQRMGEPQRGLVIFDKSSYETTLQGLAVDFRSVGHRWGVIRNLAEVPLFLDSRASRLVQLADLVAYAIFRHCEAGDSRFHDRIRGCFDAEGGILHGFRQWM